MPLHILLNLEKENPLPYDIPSIIWLSTTNCTSTSCWPL